MSNRLTFSLASLILSFAFGFVFMAAPVFAHDADTIGDLRAHSHPTGSLPAQDNNDDGDEDDVGEAAVNPHNEHPEPTVMLKAEQSNVRGSQVVITADDTETTEVMENEFTVVVTFDQDLATGSSLVSAEVDIIYLDADGELLVDSSAAVTSAISDTALMTGSKTKFEVTIVVPDAAIPTGETDSTKKADYKNRTVTFEMNVKAGAVTGTSKIIRNPDASTETAAASESSELDRLFTVTLVKALTDDSKPMLTLSNELTDNTITTLDSFDVMVKKLDSDEMPMAFDLANSDIEVTNATILLGPDAMKKTYTLAVTPDKDLAADGTIEISAAADSMYRFEKATITYEPVKPMATITAPDTYHGGKRFSVTVTVPSEGLPDNFMPVVGDFKVEPMAASIVGVEIDENPPTDKKAWTVYIEPFNPSETRTLTVKVSESGKLAAASGTAGSTSVMAMPDAPEAPADLTATAGQEKATLKWTVVAGASYEYRKKSGTATFMADGSDYMDIAAAKLKAVTGSTTMKMFEVTGLTGDMEYTFQVRVKASGSVPAGAAAMTKATPTAAPGLVSAVVTLSVPAKSYVIVAKTRTPMGLPTSAIPANPATDSSPTTIKSWSGIPNLEDLFARGGSLLLTTGKTKLDRDKGKDKSDETAAEEAKERDVLITEIMAARNSAKVGGDGWLDHQWIELYNNLPVSVTVTLTSKSGAPAPTVADTQIKLDLVSNVVTPRWNFDLGADGTDDGVDTTADLEPFVSFYRKERGKDGHTKGHWATSTNTYYANHKGTPGAKERNVNVAVAATDPSYSVVIGEIGNYPDDKYDWVELRNVSHDGNLKKWQLWEITGDKKKETILNFPDDDAYKNALGSAAGDVLLIVATDPYQDPDHPLAAGINITKDNGRVETTGVKSRYYVAGTGFNLSNAGKTLLLLRSRNDGGDHEGIVDLTGTHFISDDGFGTGVWPLKGQATGNDNHGHATVIKGQDKDHQMFEPGFAYQRINAGRGTGKEVWERKGYTGVGYKRSARNTPQHGGTPGYANDAVKANKSELSDTTAMISISEIMYAKGRNLPQWIELYNSSMTQAVNLNEWKLRIEHDRDVDDVDIRTAVTTNNFGGNITIQPNQTVLIVSNTTGRTSRGAQNNVDFPRTRIIDLWAQKDKLEVASNKNRLTYRLLSEDAFRLTLLDKSGAEVDVAGNLDTDRRTKLWVLPMPENGEGRSSILRRYDGEGDGIPGDPRVGTMPAWSGDGSLGDAGGKANAAWVFAAGSALAQVRINETYYGNPDDVGTPGFRGGGPLPVSLSKFRPERLDDGTIVVRWITESELNNAGFNILRSDTRNGQFTQINTSLIKGQGTTSERTTYAFPDTSAKPNVVYYYQIQDVSLDGNVTTLRQSRLKGDISAAGKLTTTWGELKALQ